MLAAQSPFPCHWWGIGLEIVGLGAARPDVGTYGCFDFDRLPPLPFELRGDFSWLANSPAHPSHIGKERAGENARALGNLRQFAHRENLALPPSFIRFMETPSLHEHIRSNTDCFLDLCPEAVPAPDTGGHLVRFLADSQACIFWYLFLTPGASDHAVVSTARFFGTAAERWREDSSEGCEIVFSAESFETFVCRFWLENEIWFSAYEKKPMSEAGKTYVQNYRTR